MRKPCEAPDSSSIPSKPAPTVEIWARAYVRAGSPEEKLDPGPVPQFWHAEGVKKGPQRQPGTREAQPIQPSGFASGHPPGQESATVPAASPENGEGVPEAPGRGAGFVVVTRAGKFPRAGALRAAGARAKVLHTFLHHEVQAAELYCRALLLFRDAPAAFRRGLLRVALDEIRHAKLYRGLLLELDSDYGALPVRDWFWERGLACRDPVSFVAFVGLGLEGANLEHAVSFAEAFRAVGAESAARVQEQVAREEESHVRFAQQWFEHWTDCTFETWCEKLPRPLSPLILRGECLNRAARERAGQAPEFLDRLESWTPSGS